jgi:hypothetical protein
MSTEATSNTTFQIGHVLFIDMVGYSKLLINDQTRLLRELNELVQGTERFRTAQTKNGLVRVATGDGMALVFRDSPVRIGNQLRSAQAGAGPYSDGGSQWSRE